MKLSEASTYIITSPLVVAVDTETSGLHWWRHDAGIVSFAWGDEEDECVATYNVPMAVAILQERLDAVLRTEG